jgi:hypothetical protein
MRLPNPTLSIEVHRTPNAFCRRGPGGTSVQVQEGNEQYERVSRDRRVFMSSRDCGRLGRVASPPSLLLNFFTLLQRSPPQSPMSICSLILLNALNVV